MTHNKARCADCCALQPDRVAAELKVALQRLVDVVDRMGGYLTPEDQYALWRARQLANGGR